MNGIFLLALAIIFSSGLAMTMKVANTKEINLGQFLAINYLVCSVGLLVWGGWRTPGFNSPLIWPLGIFVGFMYVLSLWLFNKSITAGGLALSTTLMRLSAAIPTLGSLIIFADHANFYQITGIVLAFLCLPLASKEPLRSGRAGRGVWRGMIWGLSLFAVYGMTSFVFKIQTELEPLADPRSFMVIIFGTALLLTLPRLLAGSRPSKRCLICGILLGTTNVLATYFLIRTLANLPGVIAYPTLGLGVITVIVLASLMIWHERLRPANYAFLCWQVWLFF